MIVWSPPSIDVCDVHVVIGMSGYEHGSWSIASFAKHFEVFVAVWPRPACLLDQKIWKQLRNGEQQIYGGIVTTIPSLCHFPLLLYFTRAPGAERRHLVANFTLGSSASSSKICLASWKNGGNKGPFKRSRRYCLNSHICSSSAFLVMSLTLICCLKALRYLHWHCNKKSWGSSEHGRNTKLYANRSSKIFFFSFAASVFN